MKKYLQHYAELETAALDGLPDQPAWENVMVKIVSVLNIQIPYEQVVITDYEIVEAQYRCSFFN